MMSSLEVEAQALNYLSFGFLTLLNNFWTWLALAFWRRNPTELLPPPQGPIPEPTGPEPPERLPTGPHADGPTKGKFTLYFQEDNYEIQMECQTQVTVTVTEAVHGRGEWWESWEGLLRMRRGENPQGWYTFQDLTALNGSVVRLWDDAALHAGDT